MDPAEKGWLPIVLCPTDGVNRQLLLPDGSEVSGAYHIGGLGQAQGWQTATPVRTDMPAYLHHLRGGFVTPGDEGKLRPAPERQQIGVRKVTTWLICSLPEGVYPTHFRPNDTVYGAPSPPTETLNPEGET